MRAAFSKAREVKSSAMYDLFEYGCMVGDRVRMAAYAQALRQAIKPGAVVLDLRARTGEE